MTGFVQLMGRGVDTYDLSYTIPDVDGLTLSDGHALFTRGTDVVAIVRIAEQALYSVGEKPIPKQQP